MADKLMYITNDNIQNKPFCRLQLVVEMFWHLLNLMNQPIKIQLVSKVVNQSNKKA